MALQDFIKDYVDGYELRGDDGDYTPSDHEQFLIMDCILGMVEEKEFINLIKEAK